MGALTWGFFGQAFKLVFHVVSFRLSLLGIERWLEPSVIGFGRGLDVQRAPSNSWEPFFPAARGGQGAKLAGGDAHGAPLTAPSRRKSYEHEIEGAAVGRRWRDCADRVDFSVS